MPLAKQYLKSFNTMKSKVDVTHIRREMLRDQEHLVVPIVALVEGVIHSGNSPIPELALADEFGKFPVSWNGRPVTLDHPTRDGVNVSASATPEVFESEAIGFLFNSRIDEKKLKTEAWINLDIVANASQAVKDEVERLEKGEVVEVSTGLFVISEPEVGRFNNKEFQGIWRDTVPDHLAILPLGTIGACSVADGCGSRVNMRTNCSCDDKETTIIANEEDPENVSLDRIKFLRGLKDKFAGTFKMLNNATGELSDMDTRAAIKAALKLEDDSMGWFDVVAVFSADFIYAPGWDGTLYSRSYTISSNGSIALGADRTRVRPETTFVPVTITEESRMNKKEKVDALIANSATKFADGDREWLEKMDEAQLDKLAPAANSEGTDSGQNTPAKEIKTEPVVPPTPKEEAPKGNAAPMTADQYLAAAPPEVQAVLTEGLRMHKAKTDALVTGLLANARNAFTEVELRAMSNSQLEKLAKIADLPDYSGAAGSSISTNTSTEDAIPAAPRAFPVKQA